MIYQRDQRDNTLQLVSCDQMATTKDTINNDQ